MKIGILGGTFNPIHNMHINIAVEAKKQINLDKVIFITSAVPPHKENSDILSGEVRNEMVKLAIAEYEGFEASRIEIDRIGKSYTYYTLLELREEYPSDELYFIIGGDSLAYLHRWYKAGEFMKMCYFVVYPRKDDSGERLKDECLWLFENYGTKCIILDAELEDISSSEIRDAIKQRKDMQNVVPENVAEYINKNNLYRDVL